MAEQHTPNFAVQREYLTQLIPNYSNGMDALDAEIRAIERTLPAMKAAKLDDMVKADEARIAECRQIMLRNQIKIDGIRAELAFIAEQEKAAATLPDASLPAPDEPAGPSDVAPATSPASAIQGAIDELSNKVDRIFPASDDTPVAGV